MLCLLRRLILRDHNSSAVEDSSEIKGDILQLTEHQTTAKSVNRVSELQITTENNYMSLAPTPSDIIAAREPPEAAVTIGDNERAVTENTFQATNTSELLPKAQANNHIEHSSIREPHSTPTAVKIDHAMRKSATAMQNIKEADHNISMQIINQTAHSLPELTTIAAIVEPNQGHRRKLSMVPAIHRTVETH